jgi:hypothetical protein
MRQIRNDPGNYLKRSDLGPKRQDWTRDQHTPDNVHRENDYLIAPIDEAGYIDFSVPAKARRHAQRHSAR